MKNKKVKTATVLTVIFVISFFSCCNKKTQMPSDAVELKYIMTGPGMQDDCEAVWEVFNKRLSEKVPGVTISFEVIPILEYKQKFLLMNTAREKIDIVNNYDLDFHTEVRNGSFLALDDLLEEYGKETLAALPEWFMDYQKVDGKIYGIPSYQMCSLLRGVAFSKEYAEKYLDIDAFKKELYSSKHDTKEMYDILEEYMDVMKADGITFKGSVKTINQRGWENLIFPYAVEYGDDEARVVNYAFSENSLMHYEVSRRWAEKGYIKEDALSDTVDYKGQKDGVAFWDVGYTPFIQDTLSSDFGYEIIVIPYYEKDYIGFKNSAGGTSLMAKCKAPEKAMQVLNLLQSDKELYNLLVFGIEGTHYKKTGEDRIETPYLLQATSSDSYGLYKWIVGNTELAYNCPAEPDDYKKWVFEESNMSDYKSHLIGFNLDVSPVSDYLTQVNYINDKYFEPLLAGSFSDWKAAYCEYEVQADNVGNRQIIDEFQRQINEFLKNKDN